MVNNVRYAKEGIVKLLSLIAIWLISITTGVGTAVFCYGSDHSQTENIFASCCTRGYGSAQKPSSHGSSVQSKTALTQSSSSCGPCIDVPLYLTHEQGVSAPAPNTGSTSVSDHDHAVITPYDGGILDLNLRPAEKQPDPIFSSSPSSSSTVLRC